jgi:hypothetical protein
MELYLKQMMGEGMIIKSEGQGAGQAMKRVEVKKNAQLRYKGG